MAQAFGQRGQRGVVGSGVALFGGAGVGLLSVVVGCATGQSAREGAGSDSRPAYNKGYEVAEAREEAPESGGMGMRAEAGSLDREDAEDAITQHWSRLVRCYEQAGAARDYAGGAVTLRFVVGLDGRATGVHVLESRLGSLEVERCLTSTALSIRFPRPHGNAVASFEFSLEFRSTGEVPVVDLPPGAAEPALPALLARVASDCQELGVDEVTATVYVDRRGNVRSIGFSSLTPFPEPRASCVAQAVRATPLPLEVQGHGLGRALIALRNQDVLNPPRPGRPDKRTTASRLAQRKGGTRATSRAR